MATETAAAARCQHAVCAAFGAACAVAAALA
jgi:hypothetical protein